MTRLVALEELKRGLREEVRSWTRSQSGLEWDSVRIEFRRTHAFKAGVSRSPRKTYRISIHEGVPIQLHRSLSEVLSDDSFWKLDWVRETREHFEPRHTDLGPLITSNTDNREWLANFLTASATRFLFYHEMAHVMRGHLYHAHRHFGDTKRAFCYDENGTKGLTKKERMTYQTFEVDADVVGSDFFVTTTTLDRWKKYPAATRRAFAILLFYAAGLSFLALANEGAGNARNAIHPPPLIRYLISVDILGGAVSRELAVTNQRLTDSAIEAFFYLRKAAIVLPNCRGAWRAGRDHSLKHAMAQREEILAKYHAEIARLMGDHSTLLPTTSRKVPELRSEKHERRKTPH